MAVVKSEQQASVPQQKLAAWLQSIGMPEKQAWGVTKKLPDIRDETVDLLRNTLRNGLLAEQPHNDLYSMLRSNHNAGIGVGAWLGLGVSSNTPPFRQPVAIVRDLMVLSRWGKGQQWAPYKPRVIAVLDDYFAHQYNGVDQKSIRIHAEEKLGMVHKFNQVYGGNVEAKLISDLVDHYSRAGRWHAMVKYVEDFLQKKENAAHRDILEKTIPDQFKHKGKDALGYGIAEVALGLLLAEEGIPVKLGHKGEAGYDNLIRVISNTMQVNHPQSGSCTFSPRAIAFVSPQTDPVFHSRVSSGRASGSIDSFRELHDTGKFQYTYTAPNGARVIMQTGVLQREDAISEAWAQNVAGSQSGQFGDSYNIVTIRGTLTMPQNVSGARIALNTANGKVSVTSKLSVTGIALLNPPTCEPEREGVSPKDVVGRIPSYRAVAPTMVNPDGTTTYRNVNCFVLTDDQIAVRTKLADSNGNPAVYAFWDGILKELGLTNGDTASGIHELIRSLR